MPGPAKVRSTDAIEEFRGALSRFEQRAQNAVDTLAAEVRLAVEWLEHDCPAHWKKQIRISEDAVHQAKVELERCLMFPVAGERPACREQRSALRKAQTRLEYCREKRELTKHWNRQLQHEQFEYEGRLGKLQRLLEIESPAARGKLQSIVRRLEEYKIERPPESSQKSSD
jgi:exonuclease VII large subunit